MKNNAIKFIKSIFIIAILYFGIQTASAQVLPPPGPAPSGGGGPAAVPLDPVSWIMLAAGGGIAAKKYANQKKKNNLNL